MLIVTGVTLRAEAVDRPIAYRLRETVSDRLAALTSGSDTLAPEVVVCSDVWWLNHAELRVCPTISVGAPESSALTAYLASRLPTAFAVTPRFVVQTDLSLTDLMACCWGASGDATSAAVDAFVERYLDDFLVAVVRRHA